MPDRQSRLAKLADDPLPPESVKREAERVLGDPYGARSGEKGRVVREEVEPLFDPSTGRSMGHRVTRTVTVQRDPSAPAPRGEAVADGGEIVGQIVLGILVLAAFGISLGRVPVWMSLAGLVVGATAAMTVPTLVRTREQGGTIPVLFTLAWHLAGLLLVIAGLQLAGWWGLAGAGVVLLGIAAAI